MRFVLIFLIICPMAQAGLIRSAARYGSAPFRHPIQAEETVNLAARATGRSIKYAVTHKGSIKGAAKATWKVLW